MRSGPPAYFNVTMVLMEARREGNMLLEIVGNDKRYGIPGQMQRAKLILDQKWHKGLIDPQASLDLLLYLIPFMLHESRQVRIRSVRFLQLLARACSNVPLEDGDILHHTMKLLNNGRDAIEGVRNLFQHYSAHFSCLIPILIPAMKSFIMHPSVDLQCLGLTVSCTLLVNNIEKTDHAISQQLYWNLLFQYKSFNGETNQMLIVAFIISLSELACTVNDLAFGIEILHILLHDRPGKGSHKFISTLIAKLSENNAVSLLPIFLKLCSDTKAHGDLGFAMETFVHVMTPDIQISVISKLVLGLENILLAPQSSFRFGALICIDAIAKAIRGGTLKVVMDSILYHLINCCMESFMPCAQLALSAVSRILIATNHIDLTKRIQNFLVCKWDCKILAPLLSDIICVQCQDRDQFMERIASGLCYQSLIVKEERIYALSIWSACARTATSLDCIKHTVSVLEDCSSLDQVSIERLVSAVCCVAKNIDGADALVAEKVVKVISDSILRILRKEVLSSLMFREMILLLEALPLNTVSITDMLEIQEYLLLNCFACKDWNVRLHLYNFIREEPLWRSADLLVPTISTTLCCCGDISSSCMEALVHVLEELLKEIGQSEMASYALQYEFPDFETRLIFIEKMCAHFSTRSSMKIIVENFPSSKAAETMLNYFKKVHDDSLAEESHFPLFAATFCEKMGLLESGRWTMIDFSMQHHNPVFQNAGCASKLGSFRNLNGTFKIGTMQEFLLGAFNVISNSSSSHVILMSNLIVLFDIVNDVGISCVHKVITCYFVNPLLQLVRRGMLGSQVRVCAMRLLLSIMQSTNVANMDIAGFRDTCRKLFSSVHTNEIQQAIRCYPVIVEIATTSPGQAREYLEYLTTDLALLHEKPPQQSIPGADPLLTNLSPCQVKYVLVASIRAVGEIRNPDTASEAIDLLFDILHHENLDFRTEALSSVLKLSRVLEKTHMIAVRWVTLPLLLEPQSYTVFEQHILASDAVTHRDIVNLASENQALNQDPFFNIDKSTNIELDVVAIDVIGNNTENRELLGAIRACKETGILSYESVTILTNVSRLFCGDISPSHIDLLEFHFTWFLSIKGVSVAAAILLSQVAREICQDSSEEVQSQTRNIITTLFASLSPPSGSKALSVDHNMILSCGFGLKNVALIEPEPVIRFLMEHLHASDHLSFGHLHALRLVLETSDFKLLQQYVPQSQAKSFAEKLLSVVKSHIKSTEMKRAALSLIGQIALLGGPQELTNVVRSIVSLLEETSDAAMHSISQDQLRRVLESLDSSHPLVKTLTDTTLQELISYDTKKRRRALTVLGIVGNVMPPQQLLTSYIRFMADPDERLSQHALKNLISCPPKLLNEDDRYWSKLKRVAKRFEGQALTTKSSGSKTKATFPIMDDDPLNISFLQNNEQYRDDVAMYGFDVQKFVGHHVTLARNRSFSKKEDINSILPLEVQNDLLRYPACCRDLLDVLLSLDSNCGAALLVSAAENINDASKFLAGSIDALFSHDETFDAGAQQIVHNLKVHCYIAQAFKLEELEQLLIQMQNLADSCSNNSVIIRNLVGEKMKELSMLATNSFEFPVVSLEQFDLVESSRSMMYLSISDKKHREQLGLRRVTLQHDISSGNDWLWLLTQLQRNLMSDLGKLYMQSHTGDLSCVQAGFSWLSVRLTKDEHRDLRLVARNSIVGIAKCFSSNTLFTKQATVVFYNLVSNLDDSDCKLYRSKVDLLWTVASLVPFVSDVPDEVLESLCILVVQLWDDADHHVRHEAISAIQMLMQNSKRILSLSKRSKTFHVEKEIGIRRNLPQYPDIDELLNLLQWIRAHK